MSGPLLKRGELKDFHARGVGGNPVHRSAEQVRAALSHRAGPHIANMLAFPKRSDSGHSYDWYAPVGGEVVNWNDATEEQRAAARPHIRELRDSLLGMADSYGKATAKTMDDQGVFAAILPESLKIPDEGHVFLVGGMPVLVFWGFTHHGAPEDEDVLARMLEEPVEDELPPPPPPPGGVVVTEKRRFPWKWLLLLLLLLVLLAGLWWWWSQRDETLAACPEPPSTPPAPVKEVMMVMDVSGSMSTPSGWDESKDVSVINWIFAAMNPVLGDDVTLSLRLQLEYFMYGESRLEVAKSAMVEVVDNLPENVGTGLVVFGECNAVTSQRFATGERAALKSAIGALEPLGGTPLAEGLSTASSMVSGQGDGSLIVVLSDGQDSCDGDPCAVARRIAVSKPRVRINVVDIGNVGAGTCLAQATGGRVVVAQDPQSLKAMIRQAANPLDVPEHCR